MFKLLKNTPIERYVVDGKEIYVKREDLATGYFPAPSNAKARGILAHIEEKVIGKGYEKVAIVPTLISRADWVLSWVVNKKFSNELETVVFYPLYRSKNSNTFSRVMSYCLGAEMRPINACRHSIMEARAMKLIDRKTYMMPKMLMTSESVFSVGEEAMRIPDRLLNGTIVVSVGSGTMLSGIIFGLLRKRVLPKKIVGVLVTKRTPAGLKIVRRRIMDLINLTLFEYIKYKAEKLSFGTDKKKLPLLFVPPNLELVNSGYNYTDAILDVKPPFPCDQYYDRKAWKWLLEHYDELPKPVLFWNVGGEWDLYNGITDEFVGDGFTSKKTVMQFINKCGFDTLPVSDLTILFGKKK